MIPTTLERDVDSSMKPSGLNAIATIDQFLTEHKERGMFSRREVVDLLLDLRYLLQVEAMMGSLEKDLTEAT